MSRNDPVQNVKNLNEQMRKQAGMVDQPQQAPEPVQQPVEVPVQQPVEQAQPKPIETQKAEEIKPIVSAQETVDEFSKKLQGLRDEKAISEIERKKTVMPKWKADYNTLFKTYRDNQADYADLFRGNFDDFSKKIQGDFIKTLNEQGFSLDINDSKFQEILGQMKEQGVMAGIITSADDYLKTFLDVAETFVKPTSEVEQNKDRFLELDVGDEEAKKKSELEEKKKAKADIYGATLNPDGTTELPITDNLNFHLRSDGRIDFNKLADMEGVSLSAIDMAINYSSIDEAVGSAKYTKDFLLDEHNRLQKDYDLMKVEQQAIFDNLKGSVDLSRKHAQETINYERDVLGMQRTEDMEDLHDQQAKMFNSYKARLSATGRLDSMRGLSGMKELSESFSKQTRKLGESYNQQQVQLAMQGAQIDESFVQTIEKIAIDEASSLRELYSDYNKNVSDIKQSLLLNEREKNSKVLEANTNLLGTIKEQKALASQAEAEAVKESQKETLAMMKYYAEQTGYVYEQKPDGSIGIMEDENGSPFPSMGLLSHNLDIAKNQTTDDKFLSENTGYLYVNGQLALNENNQPIRTLDREKMNLLNIYKNNTLALDRQYKTGVLSLNQYKANMDSLRKSYVTINEASGMSRIVQLPGFSGTDGGQAGQLLDKAEANVYNPDYKGGQCGHFVNNILQAMGVPRLFADSAQSKAKHINLSVEDFSKQPRESVAIYKGGQYGHVAAVRLDQNGQPYIVDSNRHLDEKIDVRPFTDWDYKNIIGFYNPFPSTQGELMSGIAVGSAKFMANLGAISGQGQQVQAQPSQTLPSTDVKTIMEWQRTGGREEPTGGGEDESEDEFADWY